MQSSNLLTSLIGSTKLVPLEFRDYGTTIHAKCEFMNPSGSIKDRFARAVVEDAEKKEWLHRGSIILECSSGNTGVALAMVGAARGYPVEIILSDRASPERRMLVERLGGKVILYDGSKGYETGINLSRDMAAANPCYFLPRQFENPLNARDHEESTGAEIVGQLGKRVDAFVAGYGTGGTLAGVSRALRRCYPALKVFAMQPAVRGDGECPSCGYCIEGVTDGFIPPLLANLALDGSITVEPHEATQMAQRLMREFGLLVGPSSGANVLAALRVGQRIGRERVIVTVLCDRAERYFSTRLFAAESVVA